MPRAVALACVQSSPIPVHADGAVFAEQVSALVTEFPATKLAVFPELHAFGVQGRLAERNAELCAAAEPLDGPRVTRLTELAGDLGVWLIPGTVCELGDGAAVFNTAVVLSPQGKLVAAYRKCFPWRPYEPYEAGKQFVVFDIADLGRVGLSICYDAWFPEVARHLAWMGAEVIVNPTQTTTVDRAQEVVLTRANAIANQVFVVSVNTAAPLGTGQSLIVDPEGRARAQAGDAPVTLTDVLDLDDVTRVRRCGTAGLNRMWEQLRDDDTPLELPLYGGRMDPSTWRPAVGHASATDD